MLVQRIRKHYLKTFGTSVTNSQMSSESLPAKKKFSSKHFEKLEINYAFFEHNKAAEKVFLMNRRT